MNSYHLNKDFVVPINGFYKGLKIKDCKVIDFTSSQKLDESRLSQIAIMGITVLGIDKNQIIGKLNTLKFY